MSGSRNEDYIKEFGLHLRKLRLERNLSQEQLAAKSDLAFSQIGRFERGIRSPTLSTLLSLSRGLDIDPKELLAFEF